MNQDLQNLLEEYLAQVETREGDLTTLNQEINFHLLNAKSRLQTATAELEQKLDAEEIDEEHFFQSLQEARDLIQKETKQKFEQLLANLEEKHSNENNGVKDTIFIE